MKKLTTLMMTLLVACGLVMVGCAKRIVTQTVSETTESQTTKQDLATEKDQKTEEIKTEKTETEKITEMEIVEDAKIASVDASTQKTDVLMPSKGKPIEKVKSLCSTNISDSTSHIGFDFDSYAIKDDAKPFLKEVSSYLTRNDLKIYIEGHCDDRGTDEYNLALGDRRASTARDWLLSSGVAGNRIEVISCGEESPMCTEETDECWSKNRRAHFVTLNETNDKTN
ncbi:MAG: OmpA family protein [Nitrospirae bacterium]|nr:OmpA family protein [Nitrospirota bacterium]